MFFILTFLIFRGNVCFAFLRPLSKKQSFTVFQFRQLNLAEIGIDGVNAQELKFSIEIITVLLI